MRMRASEKADYAVCQHPPTSRCATEDSGTAHAEIVRMLGPVRAANVGPPFRPLDGTLGSSLHSLSYCLPKRPRACRGTQRASFNCLAFGACRATTVTAALGYSWRAGR